MRHVIIGTAGHVDHGKTTLVRALTGTDTDRLAEEKARGLTIDLGFALLNLPGEISAGVVDVPGHERFVKNMLAGVGGVDIALIVVAADEGPMPQTREHVEILSVLQVPRAVIALTKCDLADDELRDLAAATTREMLAETMFAGAPLIPVAAETGDGLDRLIATLSDTARQLAPRPTNIPFRLPVDRVFSLPGAGTVVTGTLLCGTIAPGDTVSVQPQNLLSKARALQTHGRRLERATPGMRIAINLPGIETADIERGAVLCSPETLTATTLVDVALDVLPHAPRALRHRERVRLHFGTGEVLGRLLLLEGATAEPGVTRQAAQLLLEHSAAPARDERFVLRAYSPARTMGGGTVLAPHPARRYRRGDTAARALFAARHTGELAENVYAAVAARHQDYSVAEIGRATGADNEAVEAALRVLTQNGRVVPIGAHYVADSAAQRLRQTAQRALTTFHRQNPLRQAMPLAAFRTNLTKAATLRNDEALMEWLERGNLLVREAGGGVRLPEHTVAVPPGWQKAASDVLERYQRANLTPPFPNEIQEDYPRDVVIRQIVTILAEQGQLIHIDGDIFLHAQAFAGVKEILRRLAETNAGITVGTVRDATGSSRKFVLPLLEFLDARRFTRRIGDQRVLVESG